MNAARRSFLARLPLAMLAAPFVADAQPRGKVPTLGFLIYATPSDSLAVLDVLRNALRERGWREGQNLAIESRWAHGQVGRLPELAADLVARKVDVIVVGSFPAAVRAAQRATATIPIVFVGLPLHVADEMVGNIARPQGNLTGMSYHASPENAAKELEFYHEMSGKPSRIVVLREDAWEPDRRIGARSAVDKFGVTLERVAFTGREGLEAALARIADLRPGALWVTWTAVVSSERRRIAEFAMVNRLPSFAASREYAEAGGLASYAASISDLFRRSAHHVDRLLRGAKPADLPVEQPTKFELVINLKTAKALGLTIAPSLLLRADQVIE